MGGAQRAGDIFGEVRVSDLVTMTVKAKEKHLSTQTCSHIEGDRASAAEAQTRGWEGGRRPWSLGSQD